MSETPFEAPSIESIADLFPAYDIEHLIAQGGMGAVYKARQRSLDRDVAIKILPRELGDDPVFRSSFVEEAKTMARVVHPNLITIYDSGDVGGLLYIVMEYVDGESLFHASHQIAVDPEQAVEIVIGIARGLEEAHENNIVHRDIKPANILINQKREPKIGDFGLARAAGHDSEGLAMGTPGYTAPEVIHQPELADHRSDIYSVGVILKELLTGEIPQEDPRAGSAVSDPSLKTICEKATEADPSIRYQDAQAMVDDLKAWMRPTKDATASNETPPGTAHIDRSANSALGRNVAIICVLLVAIFFAWKGLERKKNATAALAAKAAAEEKILREKSAQRKPPAADPLLQTTEIEAPIMDPSPVIEEPPAETAAQSLLRLRDALAAGNFDELPIGTEVHGDSYFFFVSKSTKWDEASRMARAYGGHLALVEDEDSLSWLTQNLPSEDSDERFAWIGATRTASASWQLVTGPLWPLKARPQGEGAFAAVNRDGKVQAGDSTDRHPFFIQWQRNGSNPTDIKDVLARSKLSQETDQAFFPLGTQSFGERRFLIVEEPFTYAEAEGMAAIGGGKLMTVATEEEADWLKESTTDHSTSDGLWLGARLQNELWVWNSLEPWTFAHWSANSPVGSGDHLLVIPGSGWASANADFKASGCIIEWSDERPEEEAPDITSGLAELEAKAKQLLQAHDKNRRAPVKENADEYLWKLDVWLRRRGNNAEVARWTPRVQTIKNSVIDGRMPANIPTNPNDKYPGPLLEIAHFYLKKQQEFDLAFTYKAIALRDAFVARLEEVEKEALDLGQRERALKISEKIRAASDVDTWIQSVAQIGTGNDEGIRIISASYGSRGKFADVTEVIKQRIEAEERSFRVLAPDIGIDPDPGWNKSIKLEFTFSGESFTKKFPRDAVVSPQVLMDFATASSQAAPAE